jgi:hypothetical protein
MEISEQFLTDLEEIAAVPGMTELKISKFFRLNYLEFVELLATNTQVSEAYDRGLLILEMRINKTILKQAEQGSGPAQTLILKINNDAEVKRLRDWYTETGKATIN